MARYAALIDGKPGAYGVAFPDLPGCTAMGDTVEEALTHAVDALADWASDARAAGALPAPRPAAELRRTRAVREAIARGAMLTLVPLVLETGRPAKANLSIDDGLLQAIDEAARRCGVTRSAFLAAAAREKIASGA